ncbi:MAG: methyltransferase type 11 [Synergistaceae bacterium]|nr:methyltransferase type 11 [Synergistaceae bacterium]
MIFLRRFVGAPRQVGSVIPSSPYLARAMMDKIAWNDVQFLAELGEGTGVFTKTIVQKLKQDGHLLVFEIDPALKSVIEAGCPGVTVYGDARELPRIMSSQDIRKLDCVVSSLPFAVLPPRMTAAILDAIDDTLKPGGKLIAYQYSKHMRPYFEKRFANVKISFVLRNVPPAFVYECTKA